MIKARSPLPAEATVDAPKNYPRRDGDGTSGGNIRLHAVLWGAVSTAVSAITVPQDSPEWVALVALVGVGAITCCLVAGPALNRVGMLWAVAALGASIQVRLGAPVSKTILLLVAGCVLYVLTASAIRRLAGGRWRLDKACRLGLLLSAVSLVLRLLPVVAGNIDNGQVNVPLAGLSLQIGEFTRVLFVVGMGLVILDLLEARRVGSLGDPERRRLIAALLLGGTYFGLLVVVDQGPALLTSAGIVWILLAFGRKRRPGRVRRMVATAGLGTAAIVASASAGLLDRFSRRMGDVFQPEGQLDAALRAMRFTGLIGAGTGTSHRVGWVPEVESDYVPAALAADYGLAILALVGLTLICAIGGLLGGVSGKRDAVAIIAAALGFGLLIQCALSLFSVLGAVPLTGISTPVLAVTGSAFLPAMIIVGALTAACDQDSDGESAVQRSSRVLPVRWTASVFAVLCCITALGPVEMVPADQLVLPRGDIVTADGRRIATTDGSSGMRRYSAGPLYSDVGALVRNYGAYGLESTAGYALVCGGRPTFWQRIFDLARPPQCRPSDVISTLQDPLQESAAEALASSSGEVAVLEVNTGAVLALYSSGQRDPGALPPGNIPASPSRRGAFAPGSVFKIITGTAGLIHNTNTSAAPQNKLSLGGAATLSNFTNFTCPDTSIPTMLSRSCNTTAGYIALSLGGETLKETATKYFGTDAAVGYDGGAAEPLSTGLTAEIAAGPLARTAIGQESVRANVLNVAAATAAVAQSASGGVSGDKLPPPRIIAGYCDDLGWQEAPARESTHDRIPTDVADRILSGMRQATRTGTSTTLAGALATNADLAAKTGTAESGKSIEGWITAILDSQFVVTVHVHAADISAGAKATAVASAMLVSLQQNKASAPMCSAADNGGS